MTALLDNDVAYKASAFDLVKELITEQNANEKFGALGAARFVLARKIKKLPLDRSAELAARIENLWSSIDTIEPTDKEIALAAEFEATAQLANVSLDIGESQLCAVFLCRDLTLLLTGDKRAILAMEALLPLRSEFIRLQGKVQCLEQRVLCALTKVDSYDLLRTAICAAMEIDKCLMICFACLSHTTDEATTRACLESYIRDLRARTSNILAP